MLGLAWGGLFVCSVDVCWGVGKHLSRSKIGRFMRYTGGERLIWFQRRIKMKQCFTCYLEVHRRRKINTVVKKNKRWNTFLLADWLCVIVLCQKEPVVASSASLFSSSKARAVVPYSMR